jgi:amino acid transporter
MLSVLSPTTGALYLYQSEARKERILPNIKSTVRTIWWIYLLYTAASIGLLRGLGMPWWEAINHGMTGISTGGFSVTDDSAAAYGAVIQCALLLIMIVGAISFSVHYQLLRYGSFGVLVRDGQHRWFWICFAVGAGLLLLLLMTYLVSGGISRSNKANKFIVSLTLLGLAALVVVGFFSNGIPTQPLVDAVTDITGSSVLYASALMFVAYTGYGRIATLGEEVSEPRTTIPKAIILAMVFVVVLYLAVSLTALQVMGAEAFGLTVEGEAAPLMVVAQALSIPVIGPVITIAAITAMLGVLLNLILGLSRVMLSMARRRDLPGALAKVNPNTQSPVASVWVTGLIIGLLVLSGDVVFTWSFSAFTVLIYYAITNLSALVMPEDLRLYPRWIPAMGLFGCLFLAFWIKPMIWISGLLLLGAGLIWHTVALKIKSSKIS